MEQEVGVVKLGCLVVWARAAATGCWPGAGRLQGPFLALVFAHKVILEACLSVLWRSPQRPLASRSAKPISASCAKAGFSLARNSRQMRDRFVRKKSSAPHLCYSFPRRVLADSVAPKGSVRCWSGLERAESLPWHVAGPLRDDLNNA